MKIIIIIFSLVLMHSQYAQAKAKNILFLLIDDLRPELKSFGVDYIHSPNIDQLAAQSRIFVNQYVNAPSCGPSRYSLLTGRYGPAGNSALALRGAAIDKGQMISPSMPKWFKDNGYTTVSVGKVSHHPGGRGGKDWNSDDSIEMPNAWNRHLIPVGKWKTPVGMMHGLAHGEIRKNAKNMDVFQSKVGDDNIYPDGIITDEGIKQLGLLAKDKSKPFFLAIGIIKPHLPFGAPKKYLDLYKDVTIPAIEHPNKPSGKTTFHKSGEFMKYNLWGKDPRVDNDFALNVKKHYAASVSYADAQVGKVLAKLKATGEYDNTIIVLWGDHGWHLGEHGIWGKHSLFEESLRSPLLISYPELEQRGLKTTAIVETADIFPTVTELAGIKAPNFVHGQSLLPQLNNPVLKGHTAVAYRSTQNTIRNEKYRLTVHKGGFVELYDHTSAEKETLNIAKQHPHVVTQLQQELKQRLAGRDKFVMSSKKNKKK